MQRTINNRYLRILVFFLPGLVFFIPAIAQKDLGNGFTDHGPTSNVAHPRGIVATSDNKGSNLVLCWLFDHRGGYSLLLTDATTGRTQQFETPFPVERDAPYASILSKQNKYYTLFNGYFSEFDPEAKKFTFIHKASFRAAMAMLEDDAGNIWAATYPNCGLTRFNPRKNELTDYGSLYSQNWSQYPKYIAKDNSGWIYIAIGTNNSQIIAFDPATKKIIPLFAEYERLQGTAYVYKGNDGKVYGRALNQMNLPWYILINGVKTLYSGTQKVEAEPMITGNQNLFYNRFPNGDILKQFELPERYFVVQTRNDKKNYTINFDYTTEGSWSMGVMTGPDGKLYGGCAFPMMLFSFDPKENKFNTFNEKSQLNTITKSGNKLYFGGYPRGDLIEYDPKKDWDLFSKKNPNSNPAYIFNCSPVINRPHRVYAMEDGRTILLGGTPEYGHTGGGLLFWDTNTKNGILLKDSAIIANQATMSLLELPGGRILGGTTVASGTGGEVKAQQAELYIIDAASKTVEWHEPIVAGVKEYSDLCMGKSGLVFGFADKKIFFVFDAQKKQVVYKKDIEPEFGRTVGEQSPRIFVKGALNNLYILFQKKIAAVNQNTFEIKLLADSPVTIIAGGDYANGNIYFISKSHLCSYQLK